MLAITYYVAASVDGFIATPDGGVEWLTPFQRAGEDHGLMKLYASVDALLMGSKTYEFALKAPAWPSPDKSTWVFTRRKLKVVHPSITLTADSPAERKAALEADGFKHAWLMGGGALAASFREAGLISRYVISVMPVILGSGISMLAPASPLQPLALVKAKPFKSGVVQLTYQPAQTSENNLSLS